jgi:hypothetical protein
MAGLLIAFEGLDQSGKQTQAESLRYYLISHGRRCRLMSFPDYATAIGSELSRALHGEREYAADVMQLLYVANRYEHRGEMLRWLSDDDVVVCDRYLASSIAYGEAQGLDPVWLAQRRLAGGIAMNAISRCCRACVRVTAGRRRMRHGCCWTVSDRNHRSRKGSLKPSPKRSIASGYTALRVRAAVSARTSAAPASRSTRAHASSVAPVVLTSSTSTMHAPVTSLPRVILNAFRTFACRRAAGRSACDPVARTLRSARRTGTPSCSASSSA